MILSFSCMRFVNLKGSIVLMIRKFTFILGAVLFFSGCATIKSYESMPKTAAADMPRGYVKFIRGKGYVNGLELPKIYHKTNGGYEYVGELGGNRAYLFYQGWTKIEAPAGENYFNLKSDSFMSLYGFNFSLRKKSIVSVENLKIDVVANKVVPVKVLMHKVDKYDYVLTCQVLPPISLEDDALFYSKDTYKENIAKV